MTTRLGTRLIVLILGDILIVFGGFLLAMFLRMGIEGGTDQILTNFGLPKIIFATLICLSTLYVYDLYDFTVINSRKELVLRIMQALGITWVLLAVLFYFFPILLVGRGIAAYSVLIILTFLLSFRIGIHYILGHPEFGEKILIVGDGSVLADTTHAVSNRRDAGHRIVGFVASDHLGANGNNGNGTGNGIPRFGTIDELESIVDGKGIDRIVIGTRERRGAFPAEALLRLRLAGVVNIEESTSFFERVTGKVHLDNLLPSWLIFSIRPRDTRVRTVFREALHRGLAAVGLIATFPAALLTALIIKLESRGPIFYRQKRVGKNGKVFDVIKFRSMMVNAESDGTPVWAAKDDDRVTGFGKFTRRTRLDEIPQFWNIIKGEMSFVGPRPERPYFVEQLSEDIPYYQYRHLVAPGLTGWAQIKYPYGSSVEDARQKLQYDLYYIKNQSLTLDMIIIFETVKTVMFGRGGQ